MLLGNYRLDQWLLGAIAGSRELGLYSVAVAWAEALWYLPTALAAVQRPDLVRATRGEAMMQTARAFRAVVVVTALLIVITIVVAPVLCVTVFGDDFKGSIDDLRILAFGALGVVALKQLGNALTAQGRPLDASAAIGVAFAATVVLDILLIPRLAEAEPHSHRAFPTPPAESSSPSFSRTSSGDGSPTSSHAPTKSRRSCGECGTAFAPAPTAPARGPDRRFRRRTDSVGREVRLLNAEPKRRDSLAPALPST